VLDGHRSQETPTSASVRRGPIAVLRGVSLPSVRITIDTDRCTGHGRCYSLAPGLFDSDDEGHGLLLTSEIPAGLEGQAWTAVQNCPERCLGIEE
jgi:ferredoxin